MPDGRDRRETDAVALSEAVRTVPAMPPGRQQEREAAAARRDPAAVGAPPDAVEELPDPWDEEVLPSWIGPFQILRRLGEGGMGTVYLAVQHQPVEREVAVKVMRSPFVSRDGRLRFESERQALARLSHPNVAQLYEAGATPEGLAWFAMEHVAGDPIVVACDRRRLGLRQRLEIFAGVCDGVHHAHQKGLIHRDLKPSNVLLGDVAGRPWPKVIDFGIAKALDAPLTDATLHTGARMIGTPAYMSPEMLEVARGESDLDLRADVYALGLILYELLVGEHPFDLSQSSFATLARQLRGEEAPRLTSRFAALPAARRQEIAAARATTEVALTRSLRGDLEWVVATAVARDRERRYGSASELAAELRRVLAGEPVAVGPPSRRYRLAKFVRRNRVAVAAGALAVASLITGVVVSAALAVRARSEAAAARQARAEAEEVAAFLGNTFQLAAPQRSRGATITARELLDRGAARVEKGLAGQPQTQLRMAQVLGQAYYDLGIYPAAESMLRLAVGLAEAQAQAGGGDLALAQTTRQLGEIVERAGRRPEAHELYAKALAIQEAAGRQDLTTARVLNNLASLLRIEQKFAPAAALHRRALGIAATLGPEGRVTEARALYLLGFLDFEQARYAEAEGELRRALTLFEVAEGAEAYAVVGPLRTLADLLGETGRFAEAEPLYRRALTVAAANLGEGHPDLAMSWNNLGASYWAAERVAEAADCWQRALAINEATVGPDHTETGYPVLNLGLAAWKQGDLDRAEELLVRAEGIFTPAVKATDPVFGWIAWGRGRVALERQELAAAERFLRRSLDIRSVALPARHRDRMQTAEDLVALLRRLGREEEAAALAAEELAVERGAAASAAGG